MRELAYVVKIDEIIPIEGADRVEVARIKGWKVMVKKGEFKAGQYGIYFEIDSVVPAKEPFLFMEKYKYRVKTQKYFKGRVYSEGLLLPFSAFINGERTPEWIETLYYKKDKNEDIEGTPLTKAIGVKLYELPIDEKTSKKEKDKYKSMASYHYKLFRNPIIKWVYMREWGKKFLFLLLGRKKKKKNTAFPTHFPYIKKTDETRIENAPFYLEDQEKTWTKTTKLDGTSATYILERHWPKNKFYICSRNIRILDKEQDCYHNTNVYWEMEEKYHIKDFLEKQLKLNSKLDYVALQGEIVGPDVQGNPHKLKERQFFGFNFIDSIDGRYSSTVGEKICDTFDIPWVPIVHTAYHLPSDMEEFKKSADGPCDLPGSSGLREGFVYRSLDGKESFKNISREYMIKH